MSNQQENQPSQEGERALTIVLICDALGNEGNGTSNSAMQFATELEKLGHHVRFVGVGSHEYPAQPLWIPLVSRIASWQQMQFARPDADLFRRGMRDADVLHCYLPFSFARQAVLIAHEQGIAATAGFHLQPENVLYSAGPLRAIPGASSLIYRMERRELYSLLRHVHAPSQMIARQLREHGYDNELHVFSNGYDPEFSPAETENERYRADAVWKGGQRAEGHADSNSMDVHTPAQRPIRIVASGRLSNEKDQITLLRAVAQSRYRKRIDLRICGTGPIGERLRRQARKLGVHATIGFVAHEQLVNVLRGADLFVHPSIVDIESISAL